MFNLFKRVADTATAISNPNNYPQTVIEIHNEFFTAGDMLLAESELILKECEGFDKTKASTLKELGFTGTSDVQNLVSVEQKERAASQLAKLVNEYKVKYPQNKFITEEIVGKICQKYNLVCGDVSLYKAFVPKKNIQEIQNFKSRYTFDAIYNCIPYVIERKLPFFHTFPELKACTHTKDFYESSIGDKIVFENGNKSVGFGTILTKDNEMVGANIRKVDLQICAPIKDMDTEGMELKGYKLEKHIPDPVVLQPVDGGYLIITAWGDEASDELVVNQQMN